MNKRNKQTEETLRQRLEPLVENQSIPEELEPEAIKTLLRTAEPSEIKPTRTITLRHMSAAVAAAIVLIVSLALLYPPSRPVLPTLTETLTGNSGNSGGKSNVAGDITAAGTEAETPGESENSKGNKGKGKKSSTATTTAEVKAVLGDSRMKTAASYAEIEAVFKRFEEDAAAQRKMYGSDYMVLNEFAEDAVAAPGSALDGLGVKAQATTPASAQDAPPTGGDDEVSSVGKTNVQVEGIDEADILKNDGKYLYIASNRDYWDNGKKSEKNKSFAQVSIVGLKAEGKLEKISTITLFEGKVDAPEREMVSGLFLSGDKLVAVTNTCGGFSPYARIMPGSRPQRQQTVVRVYDIKDRAKPKLEKTYKQDGSYLSARLVDYKLCVISNYYVDVYNGKLGRKDIIPCYTVDEKEKQIPAGRIYIAKTEPTPSYLVVTTLSLKELKKEPEKAAVLGCGENIFCSGDYLYAARTIYPSYDIVEETSRPSKDIVIEDDPASAKAPKPAPEIPFEKTEIYKFSIKDAPGFLTSASVTGHLLNQFSMDEYEGNVRIATTQERWTNKGRDSSSNIYVLDAQLKQLGSIRSIAPNERIYAVRFTGKTGYVVTFEQIDPLFVVDLSNPKKPKITGELKIPGFSNYLHPVGDNLLVGIGRPGTETGITDGIKISLFDVSDPKKPKEVDAKTIRGNWDTNAFYDHKAICYYPEKNMIAFPGTRYLWDGKNDSTQFAVFTFSVKNRKLQTGNVYETQISQSEYGYYFYANYQRATYVNETLYSLFDRNLNSFSIASGKQQASVILP